MDLTCSTRHHRPTAHCCASCTVQNRSSHLRTVLLVQVLLLQVLLLQVLLLQEVLLAHRVAQHLWWRLRCN
jgi:hypothetical protein